MQYFERHAGWLLGLIFFLTANMGLAQISLERVEPLELEYNAADCESLLDENLIWELEASGAFYWRLMLQPRTQASGGVYPCPGIFADGETVISSEEELTASTNGEFNLSIDLTPAELMGATACAGAGEREGQLLCLYILEDNLDEAYSYALPIQYDTAVPEAPVVSSVTPGDAQISIGLSNIDAASGDNYTYITQYRSCSIGGGSDGGTQSVIADGGHSTVYEDESLCGTTNPYTQIDASSLPIVIDGLSNTVTYEVRVALQDDFGNKGEFSTSSLGSPEELLSPLNVYGGEPNPFSMDPPSCDSKGGHPTVWFLVAVLLGLMIRRRSNAHGAMFGLIALCCVSSSAQAYPGQITVGLKAGPYVPAIDSELSGGQPIYPIYKCFFDDAILPQLGIDFDVHVFDMFGSLELGLGTSISQAQGHVLELDATNPSYISTGRCAESGDETVELSMLQLKPGLTYRLDPLLDYYNFPFVPYARASLVGAGYAFTRAGSFDESESSAGHRPIGMRFGYELAVGMMFALDFIDLIQMVDFAGKVLDSPGSKIQSNKKKKKSRSQVFEHVYFYSEVLTTQIDNFGQPGLVLTAEDRLFETNLPWTFNAGISMEFR